MVTYCISSDCVAVLLAPGEPVSVRSAVSDCLRAVGLRPWQDMEAELFSCREGKMLIARPSPPLRRRCGPNVPRLRRPGRET